MQYNITDGKLKCSLRFWHYNGGDFCFALKNNPATSHIPVISISAIANLKEIASISGADSYIERPFDVDALQEIVRSYLAINVIL
jgi:two-component system phosphate regulon response regulator PhoB